MTELLVRKRFVKLRKSVSNFKLREGMPIGAQCNLRKIECMSFLIDCYSCLPRFRDFRGINDKSFDGRGNYTLGVTEQIIFPEIDLDNNQNYRYGYHICYYCKTDAEALAFLRH